MGVERLMTVLRMVNIFLTKPQAELIRQRVVTQVMINWWKEVELSLRNSRWLESIYGTRREFYGLLDDKTLGEALSWLAQAAVTHLTCKAMRLLHTTFTNDCAPCRIVTQTHDSIVINGPRTMRPYIHESIKRATHQPVMVHGRELVIPYEVTHGPSWAEQEKCKCSI